MNKRLLYFVCLLLLITSCGQKVEAPGQKVLILGFDGMDAVRTQTMMAKGELPNFARLRAQGSFSPLATTLPPQSPVAWSTFSTGLNPGGHGIFDFLSRDPKTYLPALSMAEVEEPKRKVDIGSWSIPLSSPTIKNFRKGETFWKALSDHGIPVVVQRIPANFPPDEAGREISGMGTPDMLGTMGTFSFFTDRPLEKKKETGGRVQQVTLENYTVTAKIDGPPNPYKKNKEDLTIPFTVHVDPTSESAEINLQDQRILLKKGVWTNWYTIRFHLMPMASSTGIVRFYLKGVKPHFELYMSPINVDPENPALPVTYPSGYAKELAEETGLYYTQGMPEDTWALDQDRIGDDAFLAQADFIYDETYRQFRYEWKRFRSGLFICYFSTTDPVQHMFFRYTDPEWPGYDAERAKKYGRVIADTYKKMDKFLGEVMDEMDDHTTLLVLSDHGFAPFRRAVHINRWLIANGYMTLEDSAKKEGGEFFQNVDWSRTKAYAIGLNGLYLNLAGREKYGIVAPGAADALKDELVGKIEAMVDPKNGERMVNKLYRGDRSYSGPYVKDAPDLVVGYARGYRGSWQTALGAAPEKLVEDNRKAWSGDHCIDPALVPGILLANRKITKKDPGLIDIGPTVLKIFSVPAPAAMTGKAVFE